MAEEQRKEGQAINIEMNKDELDSKWAKENGASNGKKNKQSLKKKVI